MSKDFEGSRERKRPNGVSNSKQEPVLSRCPGRNAAGKGGYSLRPGAAPHLRPGASDGLFPVFPMSFSFGGNRSDSSEGALPWQHCIAHSSMKYSVPGEVETLADRPDPAHPKGSPGVFSCHKRTLQSIPFPPFLIEVTTIDTRRSAKVSNYLMWA